MIYLKSQLFVIRQCLIRAAEQLIITILNFIE